MIFYPEIVFHLKEHLKSIESLGTEIQMSASINTNWKDMSVGIFFSGFLTTKPFSPFLNSGDRVRKHSVSGWEWMCLDSKLPLGKYQVLLWVWLCDGLLNEKVSRDGYGFYSLLRGSSYHYPAVGGVNPGGVILEKSQIKAESKPCLPVSKILCL